MKTVQLEINDQIAILKINRPKVLNSLNEQLAIDAREAIATVRDNKNVRALILTGEGRSFCAGAELSDELVNGNENGSAGALLNATMRDHTNRWISDLNSLEIPVVCAVNGVAAGAGVGIALAGDITIAAKSALFLLSFIPKLGLVPDLGTTWQLQRRIGLARANGLALLGDKLDAQKAADWGLIWECVEDDTLQQTALDIAKRLANIPKNSALELRQAQQNAQHVSLDEQLDYERERQCILIEKPDFREGVAAFVEKRAPNFE